MERIGWVTRAKPDKVDEYIRLHADPWPGVVEMLQECHFTNFSVFHRQLPDGEHYLFAYFEYTGDDFYVDMQKLAADEQTQRWWAACKPCMEPVDDLPPGEVWAPMDQIFFFE